jgi:uncharacterized protein DUF2460
MECFPQLQTGASVQYPIRKRRITRTVRNECVDGREVKLADPGGSSTEWQLSFSELTDDEMAALQQFYQDREGRLNSFTFLDPTDNLCAWSEKLDEAVWQKDPLLQVAGGVSDPFGTTRAFQITNPSGAPLRVLQTLNVPGSFYYCLSLWARSDATGTVSLVRGDQSAARNVYSYWQRLMFASQSQSTDETVAFGIVIAAGGSVDVFGVQVEPQIGASPYKTTMSAAGVYANARFRDDALTVTMTGPGRHRSVVHIHASY